MGIISIRWWITFLRRARELSRRRAWQRGTEPAICDIADSNHNRDSRGEAQRTRTDFRVIAGTGTASYTGDNGAAASATLNAPAGIALDGASNLYIANTGNNAIRRVDAVTQVITTVAGNGSGLPGSQVTDRAQPRQPSCSMVQRESPWMLVAILHRRHQQPGHS